MNDHCVHRLHPASPATSRQPLAPTAALPPTQAPHPSPTSNPNRRPAAPGRCLPHHRLLAYSIALDLLTAVREAGLRDAHLRDQALRAARSACLNTAEGAGRASLPDKARAFTIARGEACEAAAAVEIAARAGEVPAEASARVNALADRVVALLTGLIRAR